MTTIDLDRLSTITDDDIREMDWSRIGRLLRTTQRLLGQVQRGSEAERLLLSISRRANLVAAGMRCCG